MENKRKSNDFIIGIIGIIIGIILTYVIYNQFNNPKSNKLSQKNHKEEIISEDTLFLCPGNDGTNGEIILVKGFEGIYEKDVCNGKFIGKYTCKNEYCGEPYNGQLNSHYSNYETGIALIRDRNSNDMNQNNNIEPVEAFLYNFKDNRKLTDEFNFYTTLYKENNQEYFLVIDRYKNSGIIDSQGKIITPNIYKQIGITPFDDGISGYVENISVAIRNDKFGFLDLKTGREITNFEFDKIGFIKLEEVDNYDSTTISRHDTTLINKDLKMAYVESNNEGKIINIETGKIIKELDKTYSSAFPVSSDLILLEDENNLVDIVDYNLNSLLETKLSFQGYVTYWISDDILYIGDSSIMGAKYAFNIENKSLMK